MQLLRRKILRYIREFGLLRPHDTVVVAFSGGADSLALLDILANLPELPLTLVVAHLNHRLRGAEADADERFAAAVAARYGLRFESAGADVWRLAKERRLSLEEAGREARYAFFRTVAGEYGAAAIALGHHRDDQAETVLMRLIRGAGGSGLGGMRPRDGNLVRPLLDIGRFEIEQYLREGGLEWREDGSNSDRTFLRNRIRHDLIPLLATYNPAITEQLSRTAQALRADEELIETTVAAAYARSVSAGPDGPSISLALLAGEGEGLRMRLFRQAITAAKGDLKRISFRHLQAVDRLARSAAGSGTVDLPGGLVVERCYATLVIRAGAADAPPACCPGETIIDGVGRYALPSGGTLLVEPAGTVSATDDPDTVLLDPIRFPFPWTVRHFREGDRFTPLGMAGRKKLKDLFIDRKIPQKCRSAIPLLCCGDEIIWVAGVQLAEQARIAGPALGAALMRCTLVKS